MYEVSNANRDRQNIEMLSEAVQPLRDADKRAFTYWLNTFDISSPITSLDDALNGSYMLQIFKSIQPSFSIQKSNTIRQEFEQLLGGICKFFNDMMDMSLSSVSMPNLDVLMMENDGSEMKKLLSLLLCCAVSCSKKDMYIHRILTLDEMSKHILMINIEKLMFAEDLLFTHNQRGNTTVLNALPQILHQVDYLYDTWLSQLQTLTEQHNTSMNDHRKNFAILESQHRDILSSQDQLLREEENLRSELEASKQERDRLSQENDLLQRQQMALHSYLATLRLPAENMVSNTIDNIPEKISCFKDSPSSSTCDTTSLLTGAHSNIFDNDQKEHFKTIFSKLEAIERHLIASTNSTAILAATESSFLNKQSHSLVDNDKNSQSTSLSLEFIDKNRQKEASGKALVICPDLELQSRVSQEVNAIQALYEEKEAIWKARLVSLEQREKEQSALMNHLQWTMKNEFAMLEQEIHASESTNSALLDKCRAISDERNALLQEIESLQRDQESALLVHQTLAATEQQLLMDERENALKQECQRAWKMLTKLQLESMKTKEAFDLRENEWQQKCHSLRMALLHGEKSKEKENDPLLAIIEASVTQKRMNEYLERQKPPERQRSSPFSEWVLRHDHMSKTGNKSVNDAILSSNADKNEPEKGKSKWKSFAKIFRRPTLESMDKKNVVSVQ